MPESVRPASTVRPIIEADRLDSWKAIAGYLGREQRTVQRWEKREGLPIRRVHHAKAESVYASKRELDEWMAQRSRGPTVHPVEQRHVRAVMVATFGMAALFAAGALLSRRVPPSGAAEPMPLTTHPGAELEARISPDGAQVSYVWNGESQDNFDIYIRTLAGGGPLRMTTNPADDYSPAWSPDGSAIAFLRRTGPALATIFLEPVLGGPERKIAELRASEWMPWQRPGPFLTWSPDGKWLVATGRDGPDRPETLLRVSPETGALLPLTTPPPGTVADIAPSFSPDGKTIAFSRVLSWGRSRLCLLPVSRSVQPAGGVRVLETASGWNASPAWLPDARGLVFSTGTMETPFLARIDRVGSPAQRLGRVGDYGWTPSLARGPDGATRLVYTQHFESVNIWRATLDQFAPPVPLIRSAHWSYEPAWSPDGRRIAFLSDRTGYNEVWVAAADGTNARQCTFLQQPRLGSPQWAPDSSRIAFTAPGGRGSSVFIISGPGATPRPLAGSEQSGYVQWGRDGNIYFSSNRASVADIWTVGPNGGEAQRVTAAGGRAPAVSSDGRYVYYLKLVSADGRNDLWRKPSAGPEEKVLEFVDAYALGDAGIAFKYYRPGPSPVGPVLQFYRFATGTTERVLDAPPRPLRYGVALSPDGRYLLYAQADYQVSDLVVVRDF